jgi:hypothetical protein
MVYIDENGNRYELAQDSWGWFVIQVRDGVDSRFKKISGSKKWNVASDRFLHYAIKHRWLLYPIAICDSCAQAAGKTWPKGHIATFYTVTCDVCRKHVTCTEPRDYGHFSKVEELKVLHQIARGGD